MNRTASRSLELVFAAALALASTFATGCAPSPQEVCDHVLELEKAAGGKSMGRPACEMKVGFKKETLGLVHWRSFAGCVTEAKSMDEVEKCDPKK